MRDSVQRQLRRLAYRNGLTKCLAVFCARAALYAQVGALGILLVRRRKQVTAAETARVAILGGIATIVTKIITKLTDNPRPFIMNGHPPLLHVKPDNGFPSDHVLRACLAAIAAGWLAHRRQPAFIGGTALVALGRLGVNAHHTVDVLGSLGITVLCARLVRTLPLPKSWDAPLVTLLPARSGALSRLIV